MFKTTLLFLIILILLGCKKDALEGEKEMLIGTWDWISTNHIYNICNPPEQNEVLTPAMLNTSYSLTFEPKGKIKIVKDGKLLEKGRVVFSNNGWFLYKHRTDTYIFEIYVNNKEKKVISGEIKINNDTMKLSRSYFYENDFECFSEGLDYGCCTNVCYYVRR